MSKEEEKGWGIEGNTGRIGKRDREQIRDKVGREEIDGEMRDGWTARKIQEGIDGGREG